MRRACLYALELRARIQEWRRWKVNDLKLCRKKSDYDGHNDDDRRLSEWINEWPSGNEYVIIDRWHSCRIILSHSHNSSLLFFFALSLSRFAACVVKLLVFTMQRQFVCFFDVASLPLPGRVAGASNANRFSLFNFILRVCAISYRREWRGWWWCGLVKMRDNNVSTTGNIGDAEDLFECKINTSKDFSLPQPYSHENFVHLEKFSRSLLSISERTRKQQKRKRER